MNDVQSGFRVAGIRPPSLCYLFRQKAACSRIPASHLYHKATQRCPNFRANALRTQGAREVQLQV